MDGLIWNPPLSFLHASILQLVQTAVVLFWSRWPLHCICCGRHSGGVPSALDYAVIKGIPCHFLLSPRCLLTPQSCNFIEPNLDVSMRFFTAPLPWWHSLHSCWLVLPGAAETLWAPNFCVTCSPWAIFETLLSHFYHSKFQNILNSFCIVLSEPCNVLIKPSCVFHHGHSGVVGIGKGNPQPHFIHPP